MLAQRRRLCSSIKPITGKGIAFGVCVCMVFSKLVTHSGRSVRNIYSTRLHNARGKGRCKYVIIMAFKVLYLEVVSFKSWLSKIHVNVM